MRNLRFWGWPLLLLAASTGVVVGLLVGTGEWGAATDGCIDVGTGTCNPNWIYNVLFPALVLTAGGLALLWRLDEWPAKLRRHDEQDNAKVPITCTTPGVTRQPPLGRQCRDVSVA